MPSLPRVTDGIAVPFRLACTLWGAAFITFFWMGCVIPMTESFVLHRRTQSRVEAPTLSGHLAVDAMLVTASFFLGLSAYTQPGATPLQTDLRSSRLLRLQWPWLRHHYQRAVLRLWLPYAALCSLSYAWRSSAASSAASSSNTGYWGQFLPVTGTSLWHALTLHSTELRYESSVTPWMWQWALLIKAALILPSLAYAAAAAAKLAALASLACAACGARVCGHAALGRAGHERLGGADQEEDEEEEGSGHASSQLSASSLCVACAASGGQRTVAWFRKLLRASCSKPDRMLHAALLAWLAYSCWWRWSHVPPRVSGTFRYHPAHVASPFYDAYFTRFDAHAAAMIVGILAARWVVPHMPYAAVRRDSAAPGAAAGAGASADAGATSGSSQAGSTVRLNGVATHFLTRALWVCAFLLVMLGMCYDITAWLPLIPSRTAQDIAVAVYQPVFAASWALLLALTARSPTFQAVAAGRRVTRSPFPGFPGRIALACAAACSALLRCTLSLLRTMLYPVSLLQPFMLPLLFTVAPPPQMDVPLGVLTGYTLASLAMAAVCAAVALWVLAAVSACATDIRSSWRERAARKQQQAAQQQDLMEEHQNAALDGASAAAQRMLIRDNACETAAGVDEVELDENAWILGEYAPTVLRRRGRFGGRTGSSWQRLSEDVHEHEVEEDEQDGETAEAAAEEDDALRAATVVSADAETGVRAALLSLDADQERLRRVAAYIVLRVVAEAESAGWAGRGSSAASAVPASAADITEHVATAMHVTKTLTLAALGVPVMVARGFKRVFAPKGLSQSRGGGGGGGREADGSGRSGLRWTRRIPAEYAAQYADNDADTADDQSVLLRVEGSSADSSGDGAAAGRGGARLSADDAAEATRKLLGAAQDIGSHAINLARGRAGLRETLAAVKGAAAGAAGGAGGGGGVDSGLGVPGAESLLSAAVLLTLQWAEGARAGDDEVLTVVRHVSDIFAVDPDASTDDEEDDEQEEGDEEEEEDEDTDSDRDSWASDADAGDKAH